MIEKEPGNITPLAYNCLAYPSGICISKDENFLFVCETGRNRILRFDLKDSCTFKFTVFYQFAGRYGPTAITSHPESGNLYVALFEHKGTLASTAFDSNGVVEIINMEGNKLGRLLLPNYPEITNLTFTETDMNTLLAIDQSTNSTLFQFQVKENNLEKSEKERASQY